MIKKILVLVAGFMPMISFAQTDTVTTSPVRTLTAKQYNAYLKGTDLTHRSYVGELNDYPLPDKLLQYKKELDLSPAQVTAINGVLKFLAMKKKEIGESAIRNERTIDSLFRTKKINEGSLIFYCNRYGLYEGEFRTALLQACLKTEKILTERQIRKFESLQ